MLTKQQIFDVIKPKIEECVCGLIFRNQDKKNQIIGDILNLVDFKRMSILSAQNENLPKYWNNPSKMFPEGEKLSFQDSYVARVAINIIVVSYCAREIDKLPESPKIKSLRDHCVALVAQCREEWDGLENGMDDLSKLSFGYKALGFGCASTGFLFVTAVPILAMWKVLQGDSSNLTKVVSLLMLTMALCSPCMKPLFRYSIFAAKDLLKREELPDRNELNENYHQIFDSLLRLLPAVNISRQDVLQMPFNNL